MVVNMSMRMGNGWVYIVIQVCLDRKLLGIYSDTDLLRWEKVGCIY